MCKESLTLSRRLGTAYITALCLHVMAAAAGSQWRPLRSARLWGASEALREVLGVFLSAPEIRFYEPRIAAGRALVDGNSWEEALREGHATTIDQATETALSDTESPRSGPHVLGERPEVARQPPSLTHREEEVAGFVARGLANRQIATALSVSEHTVANHLAKIRRKLGLVSRAQIAAWAAQRWETS